MKNFILGLLILGGFTSAFGDDSVKIVPSGAPFQEGSVMSQQGTVLGLPGIQIKEDKGGKITLVAAGSASKWSDAQKMCARLSPTGKWHLPSTQALLYSFFFADPSRPFNSFPIAAAFAGEKRSNLAHASWTRAVDKKDYDLLMGKGSSLVTVYADEISSGFDPSYYDLKTGAIYSNGFLGSAPDDINADQAKSLKKGFANGAPTLCEYGSLSDETPEYSMNSSDGSDPSVVGTSLNESSSKSGASVGAASSTVQVNHAK